MSPDIARKLLHGIKERLSGPSGVSKDRIRKAMSSLPPEVSLDLAVEWLSNESQRLGPEISERVVERLTAPKQLNIAGSKLRYHVHSVTEDSRIRKFKEPWTIEWMRNLPPGAVLYDIGANIGITALIATEDASRQVQVVAIEPFPANFASLIRNIHLNKLEDRVIALPIGLSSESGVMPFKWTSAEPGAALHSFGDFFQKDRSHEIVAVAYHHCMCYTLDALVRMPGLPFPTHIKIDVDGGESAILNGAAAVLNNSRLKAMQIEVIDHDDSYPLSRAIIGIAEAAGFTKVAQHFHRRVFPCVSDVQFARP